MANHLSGAEATDIADQISQQFGFETNARSVEIGFGTTWWNEVQVRIPDGRAVLLHSPAEADRFILFHLREKEREKKEAAQEAARRARLDRKRAARVAAGTDHWWLDVWDGLFG